MVFVASSNNDFLGVLFELVIIKDEVSDKVA